MGYILASVNELICNLQPILRKEGKRDNATVVPRETIETGAVNSSSGFGTTVLLLKRSRVRHGRKGYYLRGLQGQLNSHLPVAVSLEEPGAFLH